jgi:hypothetical protein
MPPVTRNMGKHGSDRQARRDAHLSRRPGSDGSPWLPVAVGFRAARGPSTMVAENPATASPLRTDAPLWSEMPRFLASKPSDSWVPGRAPCGSMMEVWSCCECPDEAASTGAC